MRAVTSSRARAVIAAADLDEVVAPRHGIVAERRVGPPPDAPRGGPAPGRSRTVLFEQAEGPLQHYERRVEIQDRADGLVEVTQSVSLRVGLPGFSWLFSLPLRAHTARIGRPRRDPWWAPPARLSRRAAVVLATLCLLTIVVGYLTDLLADTMTYAGGDFHVGKSGQGVALGVVEAGAVGALVLLHLADRRGRRPVLVVALVASAVASAAGAVAPSLLVLTAFQLVAASLVGAGLVIIGVMAAEEMPAGSRAWALGVIGMCFGFGSGLTLLALPLADLGPNGWRWPYAISLLGVPAVLICIRRLPESRRWLHPSPELEPSPGLGSEHTAALDGPSRGARSRRWRDRLTPTLRRRLLILGAGGLLLAVFTSPASQFQNEFLHTERHLSATRISLLEQLSGTIGGLGTLIGGRLADTWGRRPVAAGGIALGVAVTILHYTSRGVGLWAWNTLGSIISYGVGPALAVYGAELFPTSLRARAGGVLTVMAAAGGVIGLVAAGALSSAFGTIAPALGLLAAAPFAVVILIIVAYPETAGATLEELNPGDPVPAGRTLIPPSIVG
ncbi:MAG: MFS transporter [Acidimicrobiales bacterium]